MSVKKYRLKPINVEAIQWTRDNLEEVENFIDSKGYDFLIDKEYGKEMRLCVANDACSVARLDDYIIHDNYFLWVEKSPEFFKLTYEEIE